MERNLIDPWDIAVTMDEWKKHARDNGLEVDDPERNVFFAGKINGLLAERKVAG
jgi:hypothetical protein